MINIFKRHHYSDFGTPSQQIQLTHGKIDFSKTHNKCRDVPCIIVFLIFILIGIELFIYSLVAGNPKVLYYPSSTKGEICGIDFNGINSVLSPNLFTSSVFFANNSKMYKSWCVSKCPDKYECMCGGSDPVPNERCASDCEVILVSYSPFLHYCVSDDNSAEKPTLSLLSGIVSRSWVLVITVVIGIFLSYLYVVSLIFFAAIIIWTFLILLLILGGVIGIVLFIVGIVFIYEGDVDGLGIFFLIIGISVLIFVSIFSCILCCCHKRISLCIELICEAGRAIRAIPNLIFVPLSFTLVLAGVYVVVIIGEIFFVSTMEISVNEYGIRTGEMNGFHSAVCIIAFFIIAWISILFLGMIQYVVASSIATWYFNKERYKLPRFPVFDAIKRLLRYSIGTIITGSGIVAFIETLRMLDSNGKSNQIDNGIVACIICCINCILVCLRNIVEYISSRAYILCSVTGESFIPSAKNAFNLLMRNISSAIVLENVKGIPVCMGFIFIYVVTLVISLLIIRPDFFGIASGNYVNSSWWVLLIIAVYVAFFVVMLTLEIITYSVDSIFIFFLLDKEGAKYGDGYDPFCSPQLQEHMGVIHTFGTRMAETTVPAEPPPQTHPSLHRPSTDLGYDQSYHAPESTNFPPSSQPSQGQGYPPPPVSYGTNPPPYTLPSNTTGGGGGNPYPPNPYDSSPDIKY